MIARELFDAIGFFTNEKKIMACMGVACGRQKDIFHAFRGSPQENGRQADEDTLFDLASATKLFTGLCVLRLRELGLCDLDSDVTRYVPEFPGLRGVRLEDLMGFRIPLDTPARVDAQTDRESALNCLREIKPGGRIPTRHYSDMHAMVLKYLVRNICAMPFFDCIEKLILTPLGMENTFAAVPEKRKSDCVLCDREHRIEKDRWILRQGVPAGSPHDPKAFLLSPHGEDLCGHAGLFSTLRDMTLFCRGILDGAVVSQDTLRIMAQNRTGVRRPDGSWTQFLGLQCYIRHPDQYFSEVPAYMTRNAIAIGGFTGNHVSLDPETGAWAVFLGNRVLDRLTVLLPEDGKTYADYGLDPDGTGTVTWKDGSTVRSSVNYVHHKDRVLHQPIAGLLGLSQIPFTPEK